MGNSLPISMRANATIPAYYIVTCLTSTGNTVKVPASIAEKPIGVTLDTILDTTAAIPVAVSGVAKVYFNDSCVSGALVCADSTGRGVPFTAVSTGGFFLGTLIGPTVQNTGTIADVLINPQWLDVP